MKGMNLRINELKMNLYKTLKESNLEDGIQKLVLKEVLDTVTKSNIQSVQYELYEYMKEQKESKGEGCEDGKTEHENLNC